MSFALKFLGRLKTWFRKPAEPQDPHAYVTANLKRGPSGRGAAVALEEPQRTPALKVFGRRAAR